MKYERILEWMADGELQLQQTKSNRKTNNSHEMSLDDSEEEFVINDMRTNEEVNTYYYENDKAPTMNPVILKKLDHMILQIQENKKIVNQVAKLVNEKMKPAVQEESDEDDVIPKKIRNAVHQAYYQSEKKWVFGSGHHFASKENQMVCRYINEQVKEGHPNVQMRHLRGAVKTYFVNLRAEKYRTRNEEGIKIHNMKAKLRGRKQYKCQRRKKALKTLKLSEQEKIKYEQALCLDNMSTDESDTEDDRKVYRTKLISYQTKNYRNLVKLLDIQADKNGSDRSKNMRIPRLPGTVSERLPTKKLIDLG
uniref:Uncharacterized protein n=1 Tax=Strigamia maritima TaxID=126957 RepID=T1J230_STRMM